MSDIDFSNEGLSERVASEEAEVGEQEAVEESAEDSVNEASGESEPAAEVAEADGEATEEPAATDEPGLEEPAADPYEVRYQEAQKVIGRQGQELGEIRKQLEALMSAQQAQPEQVDEQPTFQGRVPQTQYELLEMATSAHEAEDAYYFAVQHAPELLPDVIAEVQVYDPALAKRMEMDYYQQLVQAQTAPLQQSMQQRDLQQQQMQAVAQITSQIENFEALREPVAAIVEAEPWLMGDGSPQAIERGLRAAVQMVGNQQANTQAQVQQLQQQQGQQMRQQAAVETGTPASAPPPADENPADQIASAIFAQDKQRRELLGG